MPQLHPKLEGPSVPPISSGHTYTALMASLLPQYMQRPPVTLRAASTMKEARLPSFLSVMLVSGRSRMPGRLDPRAAPSPPEASRLRASRTSTSCTSSLLTNQGTRRSPSERKAGAKPSLARPPGQVACTRSLVRYLSASMTRVVAWPTTRRGSERPCHQTSTAAAALLRTKPGMAPDHAAAMASWRPASAARGKSPKVRCFAATSSSKEGTLPSRTSKARCMSSAMPVSSRPTAASTCESMLPAAKRRLSSATSDRSQAAAALSEGSPWSRTPWTAQTSKAARETPRASWSGSQPSCTHSRSAISMTSIGAPLLEQASATRLMAVATLSSKALAIGVSAHSAS
mmetsp:Transcript_65968/g.189814  ORF Transcript_65968/g.189814 Transcript_65968/m.189814 type:complete len:344 (+) Transcript_65968:401-1432(+)